MVNSNVSSSADSRTALSKQEVDSRIGQLSKLRFGPVITQLDKTRLLALLVKYFDVFQWGDDPPGRTNVIEHSIDTRDARPVVQRQYPIPSVAKSALVDQV